MSQKILHFNLGPVQAFVAQARRTRDLWAGSFLLSWLSGKAMYHVLTHGGEIDFPEVGTLENPKDPIIACLAGKPLADEPHPQIGSLVNRFRAVVPSTYDPKLAEREVKVSWKKLADAVYRSFVLPHAALAKGGGEGLKDRWDTQVEFFWRVAWVCGAQETDAAGNITDGIWLDQRKGWHSHWPRVQGGDHCTLMGDWQEISGYIRHKEDKKQDAFWQALIKQVSTGPLELREGERLCAIALVKRLFVKLDRSILEATLHWIPGGSAASVGSWPSTAYMAAIPWLQRLQDAGLVNQLVDYAELINTNLGGKQFRRLMSEQATKIASLDVLHQAKVTVDGKARSLSSLDGNLFHYDVLNNYRVTPLTDRSVGADSDPDAQSRALFVKKLKDINDQMGVAAQPFYAMLVMDGDRLGKLLQNKAIDNQLVSQILGEFTKEVAPIVESVEHQGVALYAGGDDVLAMLPITGAIAAAIELRNRYVAIAEKILGKPELYKEVTASTAIVFAHYHTPLQAVVELGQKQLKSTAKEENNRNSLSLTVFKPGGITASWVGRFGHLTDAFIQFLMAMAADANRYPSSFLYNLRARYPMLVDQSMTSEGGNDHDAVVTALITAEYCKGLSQNSELFQSAAATVKLLVDSCRYQKGDADQPSGFQLEGVYLARFIVDNGFQFGRRRDL